MKAQRVLARKDGRRGASVFGATAIQTVGSKGYDGFSLALVKP